MSDFELFDAVKSGNHAAVKEMIESGAQIGQQDKQGWTPLNWAAARGDLEMVDLLLQHGADPFGVGRDLRTPQMIALAAGRVEVVKRLRRAEAERKNGDAAQSDRKYCMAYHLGDLRRYDAWTEQEIKSKQTNTTPATTAEQQLEPTVLTDDDVVFLHQDYQVTMSIWPNEDVIFNGVTDHWKDFCQNELRFAVPDSLDLISQSEQTAQSAA